MISDSHANHGDCRSHAQLSTPQQIQVLVLFWRVTFIPTVSYYPSSAKIIENLGVNHGGRRIFRPTITHIWATPKLRALASSPHRGRSSLLPLVWALLRYRLQYLGTYDTGFIIPFLTHARMTWNAGAKQMLVYIINICSILNYADPSPTFSDIVSADSGINGNDDRGAWFVASRIGHRHVPPSFFPPPPPPRCR